MCSNKVSIGAETGIYYSYAGVQTFLTNSLRFAASSPNGATGLFFSLSCYFRGAATPTPVDALLNFGTFNMEQTLNSTNSTNCAQHIVATSPVLSGVTDDNLRNWCGAREKFTTYPSSGSNPFVPLAIVEEADGTTFVDGTIGFPYILARAVTPGAANNSLAQPKPQPRNRTPQNHFLPMEPPRERPRRGYLPDNPRLRLLPR